MTEQRSQHAMGHVPADPLAEEAIGLVEQLQAELNELREQLAASNRLGQLGLLTAALAHETNNAMAPVRSYAQLALGNLDDQALVERALRSAVQGSRKVARLNDRVIEMASPKAVFQTAVCDLDSVLEAVSETMRPIITQQSVQFDMQAQSACVQIDGLSLEQVLVNLIGNACQAMKGQASRKQIALSTSIEDDQVVLTLRDTGPGIPEEIRDQIFEAFVTRRTQPGSASEDDGENTGSGLGLSICREIIESAGGRIELAQTSEQGTAFRVELQLAQPAA